MAKVKAKDRLKLGADEEPLAFTYEQRHEAGVTDSSMQELRLDARVFARKICFSEPDKWQELFFEALSGQNHEQRMLALKACKGPGKSWALAIAGWWWLFTRWHARGVAMSITSDNLKDCLWTELAQIQERSPILKHFFVHRGERIEAKQFPKTWWLSARSFPQNADKAQQANTLAGLHCHHPIVLADEVGDYPDGVIVAAEAVLSSLVDGKPPDGRIIIAGNPTSAEGPLYRVTKRDRGRWWVHEISSDPKDPNRTPRVDPEWAQAQIDTWGVDSDFVKVNVLGQFPSQQANKLVGPDLALEASNRAIPNGHVYDPLVFGLDVAGYGDNSTVLFQRQGNFTWRPRVWREANHMVMADQVAEEYVNKNPAMVFVDAGVVATGLIDRLRALGVPVLPVDFSGAPMDPKFFDRRSEMWWRMADWLKRGGCIPDDIQMRHELTAPNFTYEATGKITKFKLESKKDMKKRGVTSPDKADALALTFAMPVVGSAPRAQKTDRDEEHFGGPRQTYAQAYQPTKIQGGTEESWDPFMEMNNG